MINRLGEFVSGWQEVPPDKIDYEKAKALARISSALARISSGASFSIETERGKFVCFPAQIVAESVIVLEIKEEA